jgi:putative transposase
MDHSLSHPLGILMVMSRMTSFRFTVVDDPVLNAVLARHAGAARFAYNQCLRAVKDALDAKRSDPAVRVPWSGFDLINHFNAWKRSEAAGRTWAVDSAGVATLVEVGLAWRGEISAQVFEEAAVDLGRGLDAFSRSKAGERRGRPSGFPAFKRKGRTRGSFRIRNKISGGRPTVRVGRGHPRSITLPVIGAVKVVEDTRRLRRLLRPSSDGTPRARVWFATVSRHRSWWVITLNVEAPDLHPARRHPQRDGAERRGFVGIDRGLSAWLVAAGSDGSELLRRQAPRALARALPKLRRISRKASRKQPHSLNRRKADGRLHRVHARIVDQRRYATHEVTTTLVKTHDRLCVEDLAIANLVRNRHLARPIADAAWGELFRQLSYKATWYGSQLTVAPRWFPSSKTCSNCGSVHRDLDLAQRVLRCDTIDGGCGLILDRDVNAAVNLAAWAEAEHRSTALAPDLQAGGRVTNACGGTGAGHRTRGGATGPAIPPGRKQEPTGLPHRQPGRTPEKGAGERPGRSVARL